MIGASSLVVEGLPKRNTGVEGAIETGDCGDHLRRLAFSGESEAIQTLEIQILFVVNLEPCWMKLMGAVLSASEPLGAT